MIVCAAAQAALTFTKKLGQAHAWACRSLSELVQQRDHMVFPTPFNYRSMLYSWCCLCCASELCLTGQRSHGRGAGGAAGQERGGTRADYTAVRAVAC